MVHATGSVDTPVPQHMREAADRRQQLELEHEQALAILNAKQQEIDLLQRVSGRAGSLSAGVSGRARSPSAGMSRRAGLPVCRGEWAGRVLIFRG